MEFDRIEALRIGQELKKIRKQRGLSLADVEILSEGRWKAVVIGSYERADRAITIGRLSALMAVYQAPISALFPSQERTLGDIPAALISRAASRFIYIIGDWPNSYPLSSTLAETGMGTSSLLGEVISKWQQIMKD